MDGRRFNILAAVLVTAATATLVGMAASVLSAWLRTR